MKFLYMMFGCILCADKDNKNKGELSGKTTTLKVDKVNEESLSSSSGDYRMPLVWIDLEMTGVLVL